MLSVTDLEITLLEHVQKKKKKPPVLLLSSGDTIRASDTTILQASSILSMYQPTQVGWGGGIQLRVAV